MFGFQIADSKEPKCMKCATEFNDKVGCMAVFVAFGVR